MNRTRLSKLVLLGIRQGYNYDCSCDPGWCLPKKRPASNEQLTVTVQWTATSTDTQCYLSRTVSKVQKTKFTPTCDMDIENGSCDKTATRCSPATLYTRHSLRAHSIGSPSVNLWRIDDKVKKKNCNARTEQWYPHPTWLAVADGCAQFCNSTPRTDWGNGPCRK